MATVDPLEFWAQLVQQVPPVGTHLIRYCAPFPSTSPSSGRTRVHELPEKGTPNFSTVFSAMTRPLEEVELPAVPAAMLLMGAWGPEESAEYLGN